jgi:AcrR family transcriptional regulator
LEKQEKRIRRSPEEAQRLILDAAERTMGTTGPAGLRLQDVAREAGVSHPTILHHFGSREGLLQALNRRAMEDLTATLIARMPESQSAEEGIARTFAAYRDGVAARLVWLLQAGALPAPGKLNMYDDVVDSLHGLRQRFAAPGHVPDIADTRHVVHLTAVAAMGDALIGSRLRGSYGETSSTPFEHFLAGLIRDFLAAKI